MADETVSEFNIPWEEAVKKAQLLVADMAFCKNCGATSEVALTPKVVKKLYDEYVRLGFIGPETNA